jgi:hypothetical protein
MSREQVSIDDTIEYLNELLSVDANAIAALVGFRVQCNAALRDHPTVKSPTPSRAFQRNLP